MYELPLAAGVGLTPFVDPGWLQAVFGALSVAPWAVAAGVALWRRSLASLPFLLGISVLFANPDYFAWMYAAGPLSLAALLAHREDL